MISENHADWLWIIGFGMMGLTVVIHTIGSALWLKALGKRLEKHLGKSQPPRLFEGIITTAIALLSLHILEAYLWAVLYLQLPGQAGLKNMHEAFYFSLITFTSVGYGDITLEEEWHLLSGIEGMVGIFVFGLTTALQFAVIQKSWKVRHPKPEI